MVILNGVNPDIEDSFVSWAHLNPKKVVLHSFEENDVRLSRYWHLIKDIKTKWVAFPSDDDVLNDSFFAEWDSFQRTYCDFGAVGTNLKLIDFTGVETGSIKVPSLDSSLSSTEYSAKAFSETPFLWPGLIMQVSALPKEIPASRYVIDWWIGLFLTFTTRVANSGTILVNYRVHDMQESAVASLSRKNFEAIFHLSNFIMGDFFAKWVVEKSSEEICSFLEYFLKHPPIYGDLKFSSELVSILTGRVALLRDEPPVRLTSMLVNALAHNVLISEDQLGLVGLPLTGTISEVPHANFNVIFSSGVCARVELMFRLKKSNGPHFPSVVLGCKHSVSIPCEIRVDCELTVEHGILLDQLIVEITDFLASKQYFRDSVSPFEFSLIRRFRRLKSRIPSWVMRFFWTNIKK
jgi:hypothetical protein